MTNHIGRLTVDPALAVVAAARELGPFIRTREIVDSIGGTWLFHAIFGPVGSELGTSPGNLPARLGPPNFEFGVIAGNQPINALGWWLIPGRERRRGISRKHATRRHE